MQTFHLIVTLKKPLQIKRKIGRQIEENFISNNSSIISLILKYVCSIFSKELLDLQRLLLCYTKMEVYLATYCNVKKHIKLKKIIVYQITKNLEQ